MIATRNLGVKTLVRWTWPHLVYLTIYAILMAFAYKYHLIKLTIPWLPVSVIGTAVAFYVGFKNNSAYDRMWEARKIWGAIVNSSRSWGMMVDGYISNLFATSKLSDGEIFSIKKQMIYRHIQWLYTLREQLLIPTEWEHSQQGKVMQAWSGIFRMRYGVGLYEKEIEDQKKQIYLSPDEEKALANKKNKATHLLNNQSRQLKKLREKGLIDDFRHVEMMEELSNFYTHQGKCERIKKFPLPRQYAYISRFFVGIFVILIPFSLVPELMEHGGKYSFWLSVPISVLVSWIYIMMELVGDYSENPFQSMTNDIPMMNLCRVIEIDLRQILEEENLPDPIVSKHGILM